MLATHTIKRHPQQKVEDSVVKNLIVPSIRAFYQAIIWADETRKYVLQDLLRLLEILYCYGSRPAVCAAIMDGIRSIPLETYLMCLPQIVARIDAPSPRVRNAIAQILITVGEDHPMAIVYSLSVAAKDSVHDKKHAALAILDKLRRTPERRRLVEQALHIGRELVRVAASWLEIWYFVREPSSVDSNLR